MIYNRNTYDGEFLTKDDFITGIGYDTQLLGKLMKKKDNEFDFYHENGMSIDGTIRVKKYHPLLNKVIIDNRDGEKGIIESVHKHWYYGNYWCLVFRKMGTKSHGVLNFKNENSIDKTTLQAIKETEKNWIFEDNNLTWNKF